MVATVSWVKQCTIIQHTTLQSFKNLLNLRTNSSSPCLMLSLKEGVKEARHPNRNRESEATHLKLVVLVLLQATVNGQTNKCSFDENALLLSVHCTLHLVSSLKIKANIKKEKVRKAVLTEVQNIT